MLYILAGQNGKEKNVGFYYSLVFSKQTSFKWEDVLRNVIVPGCIFLESTTGFERLKPIKRVLANLKQIWGATLKNSLTKT